MLFLVRGDELSSNLEELRPATDYSARSACHLLVVACFWSLSLVTFAP